MLKKTVTFKDYNGNSRTMDYYFNLTEEELTTWRVSESGGIENVIQRLVKEEDEGKMVEIVQGLIKKAYGKKSDDGLRFMKNKEILDSFVESPAYTKIFMELATDDVKAAEFINGVADTENKIIPVADGPRQPEDHKKPADS